MEKKKKQKEAPKTQAGDQRVNKQTALWISFSQTSCLGPTSFEVAPRSSARRQAPEPLFLVAMALREPKARASGSVSRHSVHVRQGIPCALKKIHVEKRPCALLIDMFPKRWDHQGSVNPPRAANFHRTSPHTAPRKAILATSCRDPSD